LIVTTDPDFRVAVQPNSLIVTQGQNAVANYQIQAVNGYGLRVTVSTSGLPAGVSTIFTPAFLVPPGSGTVQFVVGTLTPPGVYQILITATDGSLTHQAAFQLTVLQRNTAGSWRQQALGLTTAKFYGVIVGDVGNIGRSRVYASGGLGAMYEYSFDGASWSFSRMPVGVTADAEMHNMAIGPGRNDGVNRLYIAVSGGDKVYECSWVNGTWQVAVVATLRGATEPIIGDGRNDGRIRMYVTWMSGTTEFTWNGSGWTQVTMSSNETGWVHGIDLGPGRSDGINRVYTANQGNGQVYEYSWDGATWSKLLMGSSTDMRNVKLGQGRNDGRVRVYTASGDSNLYEYTWTGSAWLNESLGNAGVSGVKVQSIPAKAKSDNLARIYGSASDGGVYEYDWTGFAWQTSPLGRATAYMYGLAAGDGLNKGTTQIYGASYDGNAYLFEWIPADTKPVTAPNVVNLTQAAATSAITGAGLIVGTVSTATSTSVAAGSVISQNPAAGAQVVPGSAVALVVSLGPPVTVPNVVNLTQAAATSAITGAGLVVGTVSTATSTSVRAGSVISQNPAADVQVALGSAVALVVSSGPPPVGPTVDKIVFSDGSGARTTAPFSTSSAAEVLVAFAASDEPTSGGQSLTVSGAGLTWTLVQRANTQLGPAEIWTATATNQLTNVTVTSTQAVGGYYQSLTVVTFTGAGGIGASAVANAATGAPTISLTTQAGSLVYGVGNDWDKAIARTVGANQALVHQSLAAVGDTYWVQNWIGPLAVAGTRVQLNDTAPTTDRWNFASVEILVK
jgi:hypothetical protein